MKKLLKIREEISFRDGSPVYEDRKEEIRATIGSCIIKALDSFAGRTDSIRKMVKVADAIDQAIKEEKSEVELEDNDSLDTIRKAIDEYPFIAYVKARVDEAIDESEKEYRTRNEERPK